MNLTVWKIFYHFNANKIIILIPHVDAQITLVRILAVSVVPIMIRMNL
ncbi:unnamed protein product [Schistosoma curassoni]|uniref:Uncharacterized protein n=1 Tax=Schistosoma curassoni TaxID=6186 RepID=A0A183JPI2_9TREM|nr:unnamed protein product [Schistosoma curassoni]